MNLPKVDFSKYWKKTSYLWSKINFKGRMANLSSTEKKFAIAFLLVVLFELIRLSIFSSYEECLTEDLSYEIYDTVKVVPTKRMTDAEYAEYLNEYNERLIELNLVPTTETRDRSKEDTSLKEKEEFMIELARITGWNEVDIPNFLKRSYCESGWETSAFNPAKGGHIGLFQISLQHWRRFGYNSKKEFERAMYDARKNAEVARRLYEDSGNWRDWMETDRCVKYGPTRKGRSRAPWNSVITIAKSSRTS